MAAKWQIFDTKYQTADGLITEVVYGCTVEIGTDIDRSIGTITLTGDPTSSNFIPFSRLTENTIIGWVKSTLGSTTVNNIETGLREGIEARIAAREGETEKNGLPWLQ